MIRKLIGHRIERSSRVLAEYLLPLKAPSWFSPPGTQAVLGQNLWRWSGLDKMMERRLERTVFLLSMV